MRLKYFATRVLCSDSGWWVRIFRSEDDEWVTATKPVPTREQAKQQERAIRTHLAAIERIMAGGKE